MHVLYCAPTSKWRIKPLDDAITRQLKAESTGAMEIALIERFSSHPRCINREGGDGDCPSNGSPHFTYVVLR